MQRFAISTPRIPTLFSSELKNWKTILKTPCPGCRLPSFRQTLHFSFLFNHCHVPLLRIHPHSKLSSLIASFLALLCISYYDLSHSSHGFLGFACIPYRIMCGRTAISSVDWPCEATSTSPLCSPAVPFPILPSRPLSYPSVGLSVRLTSFYDLLCP